MGKNLVICCDGTNNSLEGHATNVAQIWHLSAVKDTALQLRYYDAGVGVEADPGLHTRIGAKLSRWSGSAFGSGLVDNVEQAYLRLIETFTPGDRVFLFGFSRGAYTVRVIAGLLKNYGLLKPEHTGRAGEVVRAFRNLFPKKPDKEKPDARQRRFDEASNFRENLGVDAPVHFMGIFDTVSSLGWAWDPKTFPNTSSMPNVQIIRHALALDERRAKFRTNRIKLIPGNDHREVWFAGVHSDVGGGYKAPRERLARVPLAWMLAEAKKAGLLVDPDAEAKLGLVDSRLADEQADQNESLVGFWKGLEYLPLPHRENTPSGWVEKRRTYKGKGWRRICETAEDRPWVHDSLQRRTTPVKNTYWPEASARSQYC